MYARINRVAPTNWIAMTLFQLSLMILCALSFEVKAHDKKEHLDRTGQVESQDIFEYLQVPERLPALALSSLGQSSSFVEHVEKTLRINNEVRTSQFFLVHDTDEKGNMKLRVRYSPDQLADHKKTLENVKQAAYTEYKIRQYASSYDKNSLTLDEDAPGVYRIGFDYSEFALPQDLAYFRFMRGEILIDNGDIVSMTVTNTQDFNYQTAKVEEYRQEILFDRLDDGEYVLKGKTITAKGKCRGVDCEQVYKVTPVAFYDDITGAQIKDEFLLSQLSNPSIREEEVKLERVFPIMGDYLRRKGIDLPLPFGVSMAYRKQDMNLDFTSFSVFNISPEILDQIFDPTKSSATVNAESFTIRGDAYILPFWNVFGYVGRINVDADVDAHFNGIDTCLGLVIGDDCIGEHIQLSPTQLHIPLELRYNLYGVGTTLAVGYKNVFGSVTGTYSVTQLDGSNKLGDGIVTIQPMLGYQFPQARAQIFIGAEYQGLDHKMTGTVNLGGVEMDYDVGVEIDRWAGLVGFNKELGKNFSVTGLLNHGSTRTSATINLGYRF